MAFSDNVWWTRKAKIQTEKRLLSNAFQAQLLLLWYSFSGVAVSIYYLKFEPNNSSADLAGITWVVYSVLILCISGFINGLSFKERAGLIKECYETLHSIYQHALKADADINTLSNEYNKILGVCENHTAIDYDIALCEAYLRHNSPRDKAVGLDRLPTKFHYISVCFYFFKRLLILISLYSLPIIIFFLLEKIK